MQSKVAEPIERDEAQVSKTSLPGVPPLPPRCVRPANFTATGAKCWCPRASVH